VTENDSDALDELFAAPVEDFVATRDALVRRLKAAGDKQQAAVVKGWRRPSRVVGALNRLALTDTDATSAFVEAVRKVADLQASGGRPLREANDQLRSAVRRAAAAAAGGLSPKRTSDLGEVSSALLTIGADPEALASFEQGRLLDLPHAGEEAFGFGFGLELSPGPATTEPSSASNASNARPDPQKRSEVSQADDLAARRRQADRRRLAAEVEAAEVAMQEATARAADADGAIEAVRVRVEQARQALVAAEAELAEAEDASAAAQTAVSSAVDGLQVARTGLDDLDP
jgi:hypothetical protein